MYFEEKLIASGFMFIFAVVVWFTRHPKSAKGFTNPSNWWWGAARFLFNADGTKKKIYQIDILTYLGIMGISFWTFPDLWSYRE
jgi:hypothetical protein